MTVNVEPVESILRIFHSKDEASSMAPYDATGTIHYHGDVAVAYGFHGKIRFKDIKDIAAACKAAGAKWFLAHRKEGHTIPYGRLMPEGPFAGWWYVDLDEVA